MDYYGNFNETVNSKLGFLVQPNVRAALSLALVLYGGLAKPLLPASTNWLFGNFYFRLAVCFLIVWTGNKDPVVAIAVSVAFLAVLNVANNKGPFEAFEGPSTAIYPGCMNLTLYDLLESFQNDKDALMSAMLNARIPADVKINDYYAPLIGTYLMNRGFVLKSPCTPPGTDQRIGSWLST